MSRLAAFIYTSHPFRPHVPTRAWQYLFTLGSLLMFGGSYWGWMTSDGLPFSDVLLRLIAPLIIGLMIGWAAWSSRQEFLRRREELAAYEEKITGLLDRSASDAGE